MAWGPRNGLGDRSCYGSFHRAAACNRTSAPVRSEIAAFSRPTGGRPLNTSAAGFSQASFARLGFIAGLDLSQMLGTLARSYTAVEAGLLSRAVAAVALLGVIGFRHWRASRVTAEERERRRRALLVARGKMGDALLVEIR